MGCWICQSFGFSEGHTVLRTASWWPDPIEIEAGRVAHVHRLPQIDTSPGKSLRPKNKVPLKRKICHLYQNIFMLALSFFLIVSGACDTFLCSSAVDS